MNKNKNTPKTYMGVSYDEVYLSTKDLAGRWGMHEGSLSNMRADRRGPAYLKLNNVVRYPLSAILEYEKANLMEPTRQRDRKRHTPKAERQIKRILRENAPTAGGEA